jgi:Na+/melibiose symporter-like transporter
VIAAGGALVWGFLRWQRHREATGNDPLVHLDLVKVPPLRSGLMGLFSQNLILMGVFFVVPLYLQLVLGLDALETGIKMLPVSVMMFLASVVGSRLSTRFPVRTLVRAGLVVSMVSSFTLLAMVKPDFPEPGFAISMAGLGVGMGLLASQLGNVVQSSVDASGRAEAGGLQYTGQQLGSSLGVALIGAIVLAGLTQVFAAKVTDDPRISDQVAGQVSVSVESGIDFVSADQLRTAAEEAGLDEAATSAIVDDYEEAQLVSLKAGLLAAALLALLSLATTRELPSESPRVEGAGAPVPAAT